MDYEKIHELSLELGRKLIQENPDLREWVESKLPELRESENERIRKELIEVVSDIVGGWPFEKHRITKKEALAYLEKQKEQKEELVYRLNGLMQDYIKEGKDDEEKEHRLKCYQLFWDALEDANFFEQKEQKPVEWSEEDEVMLKCVMISVRALRDADGAGIGSEYDHELDWLENRFKSLRPSWKPSEEQMKSLQKFFIEGVKALTQTDCNAINSIYLELKKL